MSGWIRDIISTFGYSGLAFLLFIENIFPPIPSEVVLPLAGFLVFQGQLQYELAIIASTAGSVLGAVVLYYVGYFGGKPFIDRYGRFIGLNKKNFDRTERWFQDYGSVIVLLARVVPGARSVVSVPAGILEMPFLKFIILTTIGTAIWNSLLIGAGWWLGERWESVSQSVGQLTWVVAGAAAAALLGWYVYRKLKKARR